MGKQSAVGLLINYVQKIHLGRNGDRVAEAQLRFEYINSVDVIITAIKVNGQEYLL